MMPNLHDFKVGLTDSIGAMLGPIDEIIFFEHLLKNRYGTIIMQRLLSPVCWLLFPIGLCHDLYNDQCGHAPPTNNPSHPCVLGQPRKHALLVTSSLTN